MAMLDQRRLSPFIGAVLVLAPWLSTGGSAYAQEGADRPIGRFVVDVRGSITPFGDTTEFAALRKFDGSLTPNRGLGFEAGTHVYLYQWRALTFGLGGSVHASRGDRDASEFDANPAGPRVRKQLVAISPQLSLNFGGRDGWSYVSGGLGKSRLSLFTHGANGSKRQTKTLNYGGGGRWFTSDHLAFSLDLRFYKLSPLEQTETEPGSPRMTVVVFSIGTSLR
jgi:hypothetical protein